MKLAVIIAAAIAIVAQPALAAIRQLTSSEKQIISASFGRALKDPASAQYHFPPVPLTSLSKGAKVPYCFTVNAKNAFGGYVGQKMIVSLLIVSKSQIVGFEYTTGLNDETPALRETTAEMCALFGFRF